jgi:hypothetical protein
LSPHFPFLGNSLAVAFIDPHEVFTPFVVILAEWSLYRRAGHPSAFEQIYGHSHDRPLHRDVPGFTAWISEREIGENESCNAAFFDNIPRTANNDRG